ncbi:NADH-quinone oxidoreductase subunit D [bacterium]|nr:NADH-quinone oxidoreductase subunit D [bacterium]MBU1985375.1 NADH-quinone oxidoreductase subunit D [bacterium]
MNEKKIIAEPYDVERAIPETESEFRTQDMLLNVGPSHPAMHGIIRIATRLQGELVVDSEVEIGYLHRAFEKSCEASTWNQSLIYTDRLNYVSPCINNVGYCMAVEKLLGLELPMRGQYLRTMLCEISRLADHLTCVGAAAMELGAFTVFLYMMIGREYYYELIEDYCGARVTTNCSRVGGMPHDLPDGWLDKITWTLAETRRILKECDTLLTYNRIFVERTQGVGVIKPDRALAWGFTGPCLRSTGVGYDVRKDYPYLIYHQLDWTVPVGHNGDNFDRYLVRMEEMEQSCRILEQCITKIPDGPVSCDDKRVVLPSKKDTYGNIEGLMNHFKLIMDGHGIRVPQGEVYFAVEAGNGELGYYVVSQPGENSTDGCNDRPWRVRCRPPCLNFVAALPEMINGFMLADIIPTFGSVNMIGGELDR